MNDSDGLSLRVDLTRGGVQETLGLCGVGFVEPERANYWRRTVRLGGGCDIAERFALPYSRLLGAEERGVQIGAYRPDGQFLVGGVEYVADDYRSGVSDQIEGKPTRIAQWRVARGIGVTEFSYYAPLFAEPRPELAFLSYAEVGGAVYGIRPVATDPSLRPPPLSLAVGPNPARGAARLSIGGDARVRITVLDALGRVVEVRDAAPGTLELDTSRWAAGVYTVRAERAESVATVRLTVMR